MFILQVISASGAESPESDQNPPPCAPQVSTVVQGAGDLQERTNRVQVSTPVPTNVFTGKLQIVLSFITGHIRFFVEDGHGTYELVLYWKFTEANIPEIRDSIYFGDNKINCLQKLAWWVTNLTTWG